MNLQKLQDCERTKIERWSKFQLSNAWKIKGVIISVLIFIFLISLKFIDNEPLWAKEVLKRLLIVGFLIISLSKDREEDEMIASLRAKSYALAFVFGVLYALIQPGIEHILHTYVYEPNPSNTFSYFEILFFMLLIQIMFFEILKRNR
ncbi:hypothetical protein [Psychroserpens mesophilus]|uniref:hypothetical protein n=1 Tax=Psychroserpens mesophilus TaxID=325473 RepID=UPI003D64D71A